MPYSEKMNHRYIFIGINIGSVICITILFWLIWYQQERLDTQSREIQIQRYDAVINSCLDQNMRHDAALHRLNLVYEHVPKTPQTTASRVDTISLINAMIPKRDCTAFAKRVVKPLSSS